MPDFEKLVVVTKKTQLEELVERFNTLGQARFYVEHMGLSFDEYIDAHEAYVASLNTLRRSLPDGVRSQFIERSFLPTFIFGPADLVVTVGPDGLVVNTAKYVEAQPIVAVNPDPDRMDGVLLPFGVGDAIDALPGIVAGHFGEAAISMARARLNDGQELLALNDLFIGRRTHVSARYSLRVGAYMEDQSSSGIIVSTGAGSTGWLRSVITGASRVIEAFAEDPQVVAARDQYRFEWASDTLMFSVREPFVSRASQANLVFGRIEPDIRFEVISQMPSDGVIFSDGVEADYLAFNSGAIATIDLADRKLRLVTD